MSPTELPSLRWGVLGTGWISTMFVGDLLVTRSQTRAHHQVVAIGSSSVQKATSFVTNVWKDSTASKPQLYDDYHSVYSDSNVQIVYVGTPHVLHKQNCLDAIAAGKHVLCEKPFTINEKDAKEVIDAARQKGVFIMEAVWTRFFPLVDSLLDHLHTRKTIGIVDRMFIDFGIPLPLNDLPANARQKDPALGAGTLLDMGIYNLTYASLILGRGAVGRNHPTPKVISTMTIVDGIDHVDVVVLKYPQKDAKRSGGESMAICTTTMYHKTSRDFCTIEGSEGTITIYGLAASVPSGFRVKRKGAQTNGGSAEPAKVANFDAEEDIKFEHAGAGFYFEADAVAIDIEAGRTENATMPLDETLRMMSLMDGIRKACGLVYPQER